jgi:cytochrome d ubiquinol oxidase subunit II
MQLHDVWFLLIAVLWIGYFFLEGFDFGVGMLMPFLGRDKHERGVIANTIGPVWDGNEVWVITAGGAMFAAFPYWYATLFSGFYLALALILVALILRGVAFEFRGQIADSRWRTAWEACIFFGSAGPALLWGVAFANIVGGVPIDKDGNFTGNLFTLLNPYGLLGGVVTLTLFATHGAAYLALKTTGDIRARANAVMPVLGVVAAVAAVVFLAWTAANKQVPGSIVASVLAAVALVAALGANRMRRELVTFLATGLTVLFAVAALFLNLYPNVMPSSTDPAFSLTVSNASSTELTLQIMTGVAVVFTPIVVIYQGWTYWMFRQRAASPRVTGESGGAPGSSIGPLQAGPSARTARTGRTAAGRSGGGK